MTQLKRIPALLASIALGMLTTAASGQAGGSYTLSGSDVAIYNLAGTIEVVSGRGSDVRITIEAHGSDANELSVETGPLNGRETLRVIYPADRIVYDERGRGRGSRSQLRVRDDGTFFGNRGRRGERVTIAGSGRGLEAWADMTIAVPAGRTIAVNLGVGRVTATNVNGNIAIEVAAAPVETSSTTGSLHIDTGSGSVDVQGANGSVSVETGSGSVDVSNVRGESLSIDTGSGGVDGRDIQVDRLNVDTGSGSIELELASFTDGNLDTGSGGVRLDLLSDVNDLEIETGSGSVTVYHTADLGAQLDLDTGSGSINFDVPINVSRFSRQSLVGTIGDGRGSIRIDTGSGSIRFIER